MIPIEVLLQLLDTLRAETIAMIGTGRDAFAYGDIFGRMASVEEMRERINALVEEAARGSEDQ